MGGGLTVPACDDDDARRRRRARRAGRAHEGGAAWGVRAMHYAPPPPVCQFEARAAALPLAYSESRPRRPRVDDDAMCASAATFGTRCALTRRPVPTRARAAATSGRANHRILHHHRRSEPAPWTTPCPLVALCGLHGGSSSKWEPPL
eukprot:scaffold4698_cov115-Isochrysis_galbana.AAC.14